MITFEEAKQIHGALQHDRLFMAGDRRICKDPDELADDISFAVQHFRSFGSRADLIIIPWEAAYPLFQPTLAVEDHRISLPIQNVHGVPVTRTEGFLWGNCMEFLGVDVLASYLMSNVWVSSTRDLREIYDDGSKLVIIDLPYLRL